MPRRQFRGVRDPHRLAGYLVDQKALPERVDSSAVFDNERPMELEIGSGKGLFLAAAASADPATNFLGIEIVPKYAAVAADRLRKAEVTNAKMIAGDAGPIMRDRIADETLAAIHVYFPDPWWKKRHRARRVVSHETLPQFVRTLRVGGRLHFWTDVLDYFEDTVEMIAAEAPILGVPYPESEKPAEHDLDFRTHFERRSRQNQIPVYRVRYTKGAPMPTIRLDL